MRDLLEAGVVLKELDCEQAPDVVGQARLHPEREDGVVEASSKLLLDVGASTLLRDEGAGCLEVALLHPVCLSVCLSD